MPRQSFLLKALSVLILARCGVGASAAPPNYEDDIKPLFRSHCLKCHNADEANADLDLSSYGAAMKGGSSGAVLQAGRPESSQLFRAMSHADGVEAMPPESPRLEDAKLKLVSDWIRSGLLAGKGAKSQLRSVSSMTLASTPGAAAPIPKNLPAVPITATVRPPIPQAIAASPGANLFAVSGQDQILLYSEAQSKKAKDFQPVAATDVVRRWSFNDSAAAGKLGSGRSFHGTAATAIDQPSRFDTLKQLTISTWLRPSAGDSSGAIFANTDGFTLYLERRKDGWTPRIMLRDQGNGVNHYGRVAFVPDDRWSLLTVTWTGRAFRWYVNGEFVGEQDSSARLQQIQQRDDAVQSIGGRIRNSKSQELFRGTLDELRLYRRALNDSEVAAMMQEIPSVIPQFDLLGAMPFSIGTIHDLKFSRQGTLLLAAGGRGAHSGQVLLYDMTTGKVVQKIGDEVDSVLAADITQQHDFVALGGPNKIVKVFATSTGEIVHRIKKHTDWITAVSFSPDGEFLATGDGSGGIHIWETENGAIVFTLAEHKVRITDLAWRPDSKVLASVADDGNMILWDMKDGFPTRNVAAHAAKSSSRYTRRTGVIAVDFAENGNLLTAGRDGLCRNWSAEVEEQNRLTITAGLPTAATFLNSPAAAVIGSFDGSLHVWDIKESRISQTLTTSTKNSRNSGERSAVK